VRVRRSKRETQNEGLSMYTSVNFKSKRELKEAIAAGRKISVYQPNQMFPVETQNGKCYLEGPHYPQPHKWYAEGNLVDGYLVSVK
jgi:hypothetical protein